MKRKLSVRMLCLTIALIILSGAIVYAAVMGSPYEIAKNAAIDALLYENATYVGEVRTSINGVQQTMEKIHYIYGHDGYITYFFDNNGNYDGYSYTSYNGLYLYARGLHEQENGGKWSHAYVYPIDQGDYPYRYTRTFGGLSPDDRDSAELRFVELLVDALVGDLKNNITMSTVDGIRIIRGTLTENQVPELVKAGIDVLIEQQGSYYYDWRDVSFDGSDYIRETISISDGMKTVITYKRGLRPMTQEEEDAWNSGYNYHYANGLVDEYWGETYWNGSYYINTGAEEQIGKYTVPAVKEDYGDGAIWNIPMSSLVINYVHGEAEVDARGNLLSVRINGSATVENIFGDIHVIEVDASLQISDIGTSNPECPIPGAAQVLTYENMKTRFGSNISYITLYFDLNQDGSIDADSITTTYPGEIDKESFADPFNIPVPIPVPELVEIYVDDDTPVVVPVPDSVEELDIDAKEDSINDNEDNDNDDMLSTEDTDTDGVQTNAAGNEYDETEIDYALVEDETTDIIETEE